MIFQLGRKYKMPYTDLDLYTPEKMKPLGVYVRNYKKS